MGLKVTNPRTFQVMRENWSVPLTIDEAEARALYESLREIFDPPRAAVGQAVPAVSRGLTMHGDSHSGWSSHDGYPSHYHSAGDVVGLHVRIYKTDGGYDHAYR
jgi:hypothetical protein